MKESLYSLALPTKVLFVVVTMNWLHKDYLSRWACNWALFLLFFTWFHSIIFSLLTYRMLLWIYTQHLNSFCWVLYSVLQASLNGRYFNLLNYWHPLSVLKKEHYVGVRKEMTKRIGGFRATLQSWLNISIMKKFWSITTIVSLILVIIKATIIW